MQFEPERGMFHGAPLTKMLESAAIGRPSSCHAQHPAPKSYPAIGAKVGSVRWRSERPAGIAHCPTAFPGTGKDPLH